MVQDCLTGLVGQVQPAPVLLQHVHGAQALLIVPEAAGEQPVQHLLADVAEGRMPHVVPERRGLGEGGNEGPGRAADHDRRRFPCDGR